MWQVVKSEIKYFSLSLLAPFLLTIMFQIIVFMPKIIFIGSKGSADRLAQSSSFYTLALLLAIFAIWQNRNKEKRERTLVLLPFSSQEIAIVRFWTALFPFIILIAYFILSNKFIEYLFQIKSTLPFNQFGILLIIFASYIRTRDDWFSHWNFGKRVQTAFVSVLIIQILVVAIFLGLPKIYNNSLNVLKKYSELIFIILGLVIMVTTIYSFQKRKSYLS
ncbi:MAG: hypothetical protein KKF62_04565 [Bacteroidetes bacterium]|nr:hypothetical protein [Bacteroidota bacterium]MBU1114283.1 hypothetical protein [Bacteroidota bacterium]MBU1798020.1 hypothetical protein [Bacteroidota bacterium]